jgi:HK97 family phage major capsid protein
MELKKVSLDGLEGKTLEFAAAMNSMVDKYAEFESKSVSNADVAELKNKLNALEVKEVKSYDNEVQALKDAIATLEGKMETPKGQPESKTVAQAIVEVFESKSIKSLADVKKYANDPIEFKADNQLTTASQTGTIMRTQEVSPVSFPRLRPTAFLRQPGIRVGTVENGKSLLLWTPAAYTSNIGYVGEYNVAADGNVATAIEKTRGMAKLGGFQVITSETFADLPQFAQRVQSKLMESIELAFDALVLSGGGDAGAPTEIWGLKNGNMTDFNAALTAPVEKPNVADLVDACATQAELNQYKTNSVWMNPKTANRLRRSKDSSGQYIINQLLTGELVMGGHKVISNTGIGADEMIVGDIAAIQLWFKQNFELEFERIASYDAWKMHVRMRAQVLVEDEDIKGLIYVADVNTALAAIAVE